MKIVTCTGYYSTGSSAICDLLSEYEGFYFKNDYELRFIYDTDGLADLEYHLVENPNRHNSGHAIKRYKRLVDFYCGNRFAKKNEWYFNGKWKAISEDYINKLTEFSYRGAWLYDYLDRGRLFHYVNSILRRAFGRDMLYREKTLCGLPDRDRFERLTREYLSELFKAACDQECDYFLVDQALPPSDLKRYLPFFDSVHVYIVDRDPRDVFFLEKYIRKGNVIPSDVENFCKWFEYTRRHRNSENVNSDVGMLIRFEDMIYHYDDALSRIEQHLGITSAMHTKRNARFLPEKSIINTQIWKRMWLTKEQENEVIEIEKNLRNYLYEFPEITVEKRTDNIK